MTDADPAEGRYLYCVVDADRGDPDSFAADGIDDGEPYVVASDGVGAVVQRRAEPFDSDDLSEVKRWLVSHQLVVDAAGETFGTPLPFRFDTILRGDDDAVREWLAAERGTLREHLDAFAGKWEYRVTLSTEGEFSPEGDERLADLEERIADAGEGTAYLLEKQREQRRRELERERDELLAADLRERLEPLVDRIEPIDAADPLREGNPSNRVAGFTLLAGRDSEPDVGAALDAVAADGDVEVEYTGPWPPYSFAPELEGEP
ncbi:gas vesicle protein GvpL [Halorarum salinum]|uniref:GvpL/GvpF family gas vesicle protein n=1 Tax=Halorarum salinum TaxID=2743089 RepID=A0A7D5QEI3_9EURY|nr:GvpL/GvpF family gas vesicle protein [Halobaculum salinum]QLG60703.1 GvpL/GvpF family gas vesicle protein [Halobaculum salinum]